MGETMIAPPMPDEQPAGSFLSRALGVFISPGSTFEDIARKPGFLGPVIAIIVAACAVFDTMYWKLGMETMTRLTLDAVPLLPGCPRSKWRKQSTIAPATLRGSS